MTKLNHTMVLRLAEGALAEDQARNDITTAALVPQGQEGRAVIVAKVEGVLAGMPVAEATFAAVDGALAWHAQRGDGERIAENDCVATIEGSIASILCAERVALNFLSHLSGIATVTNAVVWALEGTRCRLRDTRKTTPGLRALEKYAVRVGGGTNHRMDLADGVLIKDNHLAALRRRRLGIADAIRLAREALPAMRIEVEVTTVEEAREGLAAGADELLLDNMSLGAMKEVVEMANRAAVLEASGGITLANTQGVAETGVDYISMGAITHSAAALDLSLDLGA